MAQGCGGDRLPAGFVQAIALLTEATTPQELARLLGEQLARSVPGFREAQQAFVRETPYAEQQRLDTWRSKSSVHSSGSLPRADVRLVLDGLDRLPTGALGSVMAALEELADLTSCVWWSPRGQTPKFPSSLDVLPASSARRASAPIP